MNYFDDWIFNLYVDLKQKILIESNIIYSDNLYSFFKSSINDLRIKFGLQSSVFIGILHRGHEFFNFNH
jgi:hypothetical protein